MNHLRPLRSLSRYAHPSHHLHLHRHLHSTPYSLSPTPIPIPTLTATPPSPTLKQRLKSPLPIIETCPPSTCSCVPSPTDLDIDRTTPLAGAIPTYYRHLLISTGKSDWASKIELDGDGGFAQKVKEVSSTYGLRDPFSPTLITNSSFAPTTGGSAYIFPTNIHIKNIPTTTDGIKKLIQGYLLPPTKLKGTELQGIRRVTETVVLICSHTSRDKRCGLLAQPLKTQFEEVLSRRGLLLGEHEEENGSFSGKVRVGFTSHLSGHKFAGNVIVYLPPGGVTGHVDVPSGSELGLGVWYGRVEPKHVEGIVDETVLGKRVIGELCRGVVGGEDTLFA